jgi:iron complex outermembrane receptor protein
MSRKFPRLVLSVAIGAACAPASGKPIASLTEMSLEQLSNVMVTSVSRQEELLSGAAASITVISADDIRRSGATTLPEALRLAPNLQVARIDSRNYAVTARGFNNALENKLLVLIDGRTVYSPLFSGVFWDAQDVVLEDIARIEVISGPGSTLWGANAVNGVINVITRSAAETQGGLLSAGAGRRDRNGAIRYGGAFSNGGHYRVYGKHAEDDDTSTAGGARLRDGWRRDQAGFRMDWKQSASDGLTVQGDAYSARLHQAGTRDIYVTGANLLGRISRRLDNGSDIKLQMYLDYTRRDQPGSLVEKLTTADLDFQHASKPNDKHNVVWGGGYRLALDRVDNDVNFAFLPGTFNMHWANLFAQDEVALSDSLRLTVGGKIERNPYTGVEFLPTVRMAWKPSEHRLLWTSLSRTVRAPSRIDRDFFAPTTPAVVGGVPQYVIGGGPNFVSETANVLELGYRSRPSPRFSYSATAFYSAYDHLRTLEPNPAGPGFVFANMAEGRTRGIELSATWQASPAWRLTGGLVTQRVDVKLKPGSADLTGTTVIANNDPASYWTLRSSYDISDNKDLDITLRHVGTLPRPEVPAYTELDVRFGWRVTPAFELSVTGQNLLHPEHAEFGAAATRSQIARNIYVKATWNF